MSAEDMRRLTIDRLDELREAKTHALLNLKHGPGQVLSGEKGMTTVAPATLEYIGAMHSIAVAELNLIEAMIEIINDAYRTLTSPASLPEEDQPEATKQEAMY